MALSFDEEKRRLDAFRLAVNLPQADYDRGLQKLKEKHANAPAPPTPRATGSRGGALGHETREKSREFDTPTRAKAIAPYRFIEIADAVAKPPQAVADACDTLHSEPLKEGYCGEIRVAFEAETPLLIGKGEDIIKDGLPRAAVVPLSANGEDWWIPGASLRGMIRAAAEIVGYARLDQTNRNHVFSLRDFEHPYYNNPDPTKGPPIGKPGAIKAGWLWKEKKLENGEEKETYFIEPSDLALIDIRDLPPLMSGRIDSVEYWTSLDLASKYHELGMKAGGVVDFCKTAKFRLTGPDKQRNQRVKPDSSGHEGAYVVANKAPANAPPEKRKKVEYVFLTKPGQRHNDRAVVTQEAFEKFELVHTSPGVREREPAGSWKTLKRVVDARKPIPVFYTGDLNRQDDPDFAFGLTRLFKIPHRNSVGEMVDRMSAHQPDENEFSPDMVSALFGWVDEGDDARNRDASALKSRIAFSGATIRNSDAELAPGDYIETVMGAPRASFAPYSLVGAVKDWSANVTTDTRIAGRKRYGPRGAMAGLDNIRAALRKQIDRLSGEAAKNVKTHSLLKFLVGKGGLPIRFESRIALHNVTAEEIGLVLFALTHNGDGRCRHMLGRAKPFGAGQLRVTRADLRLSANGPEGNARLGVAPSATAADHLPFLQAFIDHMRRPENYRGTEAGAQTKFPNTAAIRQFLTFANPAQVGMMLPSLKGAQYPELKDHNVIRKPFKLDKSADPAPQPLRVLEIRES